MSLQRRLIRKRHHSRIGERARIMVDGPASDHELVLKGRLATQEPDIDASVFLTECDPSTLKAGDLVEVEIVGSRDYDLIVTPALSDR
jgi:tRNA A37 methylthiotransferase MiaB